MESKISTIELDTSAWMDEKGLGVCVWVGEGCEPVAEVTYDFETLIENHFEGYTVNDKIRPMDFAEIEATVIKLEQMAKYARNMLEDYTTVDLFDGE
jgi:hypothetical protein